MVNRRKRQLPVDTMGLLLVIVVTAAFVSDPRGAKRVCARRGGACKTQRLWVDGTYRGTWMAWVLEQCHFLLQTVMRSDNAKGVVLLPRRWVVEHTFAWRTQCRRRGKEYDVLPRRSEAFISLAMTRLMIRRLARS